MGNFCDLIVAAPTDADQLAKSVKAPKGITVQEVPGLDVALLADLYCSINEKAKPKSVEKKFKELYGNEDGPWVHQVPDDVVKALAKLNDDDVIELAEKWLEESSSAEMLGLDATGSLQPNSLEIYVAGIRDLAEESVKKKQSLLIKVSL